MGELITRPPALLRAAAVIPSRLDKFLADATPLSRSQIGRAAKEGRVARRDAEGRLERAPALWELVFEGDEVLLDGARVQPSSPRHYIAFNKPEGVLTTTRDPHGRRSLAPWLERMPDAVFPVGRLDRATTGFLLICDDGDLSHVLLGPRFHVRKAYYLTIRGELADGDPRLGRLLEGVEIGSGPARALEVAVLGGAPGFSLVSLVIDEGRNRIVRKMCRRAGLELAHLHRVAIGPVRLGAVARGDWRVLSAEEVERLWAAGGGRERAARRKVDALWAQATRWRDAGRPHHRLEAWLSAYNRGEEVDEDSRP